jgi:ubiquinone/menaquinone biosynthesis C-methylase UbiE
MTEETRLGDGADSSAGAYFQADQPWDDAAMALLYDAFPFDADLQFYRSLAADAGRKVLEIACGTGRVLVPLAKAGLDITGLDGSPHMLDVTREKLADAGSEVAARVRLVEGDMRSFAIDDEFDLAILPAKSFAYLVTREDQMAALETIARHLRPGGMFAIDLLNPRLDWLSQPSGSLRNDLTQDVAGRGIVVSRTETAVSTDFAAQVRVIRSAWEVIARNGAVTKRIVEWPYRFTYRFEAELLLERAGFEVEHVYGGYQGEPFTSDSTMMLFVARLP